MDAGEPRAMDRSVRLVFEPAGREVQLLLTDTKSLGHGPARRPQLERSVVTRVDLVPKMMINSVGPVEVVKDHDYEITPPGPQGWLCRAAAPGGGRLRRAPRRLLPPWPSNPRSSPPIRGSRLSAAPGPIISFGSSWANA